MLNRISPINRNERETTPNTIPILKKLLLITSELPPQPGGIGEHAHQLATHLAKKMNVQVIADQRSENGVEEKQFDNLQNYQIHRVKRRKILLFTYLDRVFKSLKWVNTVDAVIVSGKFSLWQAWFIKLKYPNIPILGVIHGSEVLIANTWVRSFTEKCLKKLNEVVAVSNYTLSLVGHLSLKNTSVIPNGVVYSNEIKHPIVKKKSNTINLITVGNLTQRKGQHNVINALPHIQKHFPNLMYHCVGIPTEMSELQDLARKLGVVEKVKFYGRVSEQEKQNLLQQADIFMMLSEKTASGDVEGFGIAILEANAQGIPAIGSINCGIEDAIEDQFSGRMVNPHKPEEVCEAVVEIMKNHQTYASQAKNHAKQFDWNIVIEQYIRVLSKFGRS